VDVALDRAVAPRVLESGEKSILIATKQAAMWFRKAATQGNAVAEANLGDLYHLGQGVEMDDAEAIA
jgi:TPR repeat protein